MERPQTDPTVSRAWRAAVLFLALSALDLAASTVSATDVPLSNVSLRIHRSTRGEERLVFVARDSAVPSMPAGGPDDPSLVGALVEIVASGDPSVGAFAVPAGTAAGGGSAGWRATGASPPTYRFTNREAPAAPSVVRRVVVQPGRRLKVIAHRAGLALTGDQGIVGVRVTIGSARLCARFDASTGRDEPGVLTVRDAAASTLTDCSDTTLGTAPFLAPGIFGPTCPDGHLVPPPDPAPGRFHRVTLDDPLAVCNDNSPAVLFVRKADAGGAHAHDWVIWLAGGGECGGEAECADRWCDRQAGPYSSLGMSARFEGSTKAQNGIFSLRASNTFKDFNQVIVPYCSSDTWIGTHTLDAAASVSGYSGASYPGYRIAFHGRYIVDATIAALRAGVTSDDGEEAVEPLTAAQRVIFSGSSAGGAGAIQNANRVAAMIREDHPAIDVQLVSDAISRPYEADADRNVSEAEVELRLQVGAAHHAFHGGRFDDACVAAHEGDQPLVCTQPTHVLVHHVGLRAFTQVDIEDNTIGPWAYDTAHDFGLATRELLLGLAAGTAAFAEPVSIAPLGIFAPRCCHHVTLSSPDFYDLVVPGGGANLYDALWSWWNDSTVPTLIDDGTVNGSGCPIVSDPCGPP